MKSFDAVDIGFENGEYVIIPARYFHTCTLRGMDVKVFCTGTHILQLSYMRYIRLELDAAVNAVAHRLKGRLWDLQEKKVGWRLLERIRTQNDIVSLTLRNGKEEGETYWAVWPDNGADIGISNKFQHTKYRKNGNLQITICQRR